MIPELLLAIATHRGEVREHNEDAAGFDGWTFQGDEPRTFVSFRPLDATFCLAVADGMGGHRGGAQASAMVARRVTQPLPPASPGLPPDEWVTGMVQQVSDEILQSSQRDEGLAGMGATVVGLMVDPGGEALVFNVGDSRAYVLEDGIFARLTRDDRLAPDRPVLSQALGGGRQQALTVHVHRFRLDRDARVLLCSDGLIDEVSDAEIAAAFPGDLDVVAHDLVGRARRAGGRDNITVAMVEWLGTAVPPAVEPVQPLTIEL